MWRSHSSSNSNIDSNSDTNINNNISNNNINNYNMETPLTQVIFREPVPGKEWKGNKKREKMNI